MKKYITALFVAALLSGCALFDWDGNGRFDPVEYLSNADISVTWVDADGNAYEMDLIEIGSKLAADYIQVKTGYRFEPVKNQDGTVGIKITDPNGYAVWVQPKAEEDGSAE